MKIAGLPAHLLPIELEGDRGKPVTIEVYAPARPASMVDSNRLLRDADAPDPPYWAFLWGGAHAVAAALCEDGPPRGATVLDLGCGLGLSGLVATRAGARVCFADLHPEPLAFVDASARRAGSTDHRCVRIDLCRDRLDERFEWILAADLLYDPSIYGPLVDFLEAHAAPGARLLITDRLLAAPQLFFEAMEGRGFEARQVRQCPVPEGGQQVQTRLHLLTAPAG